LSTAQHRTGKHGPAARIQALAAPFDRPLTSYYLLIGTTGLLLALGLVMVLSTSSATQLYAHQPEYSVFAKQLLGMAVGLPMMWLLSKAPPRLFRATAYPLMIASLIGLVLVLAVGQTVAGATRWISVAGLQFQPSEFAKLAFLLWGADLLARKEKLGQLTDWRMLLIPLLPGTAALGLLVMLGDDLGTTFLLLVIFLALLWVVGTPGRMFAGMLGLLGFALVMMILVASYGRGRITCFLHPAAQAAGSCWQPIQGKYAIGSGSLFGVGLGDGTEKWGWVPNASTDFIFAILGEELGLIGTSCVVLLYGGLAYAGLRIARRMTNPFMRLAAGGATAWIVTQAVVNIGAVVGLLPITGVPLPLISAGLSSLLATMAAVGMLLSFARREPGAAQALAARGPGLARRAACVIGLGSWPGWERGAGARMVARPGRAGERIASGSGRTGGSAGQRATDRSGPAGRAARPRSAAGPGQAAGRVPRGQAAGTPGQPRAPAPSRLAAPGDHRRAMPGGGAVGPRPGGGSRPR